MPNPFNVNNSNNNNMFRDLYQAIKQTNNPYDMFMRLAGQNPQMQPIIRAMQGGMNPQEIFNNMCRQRGINPQQFIKNITG